MCARLLEPPRRRRKAGCCASPAGARELARHYGRSLTWVLDRQRMTLLVAIGTLILTVILYVFIPKASSRPRIPAHPGHTEAPQSVSFAAMAQRSRPSPRCC